MMDVSVLLATCRRAESLSQTLSAMTGMSTAGMAWELLVVDNAGEEATRKVCQSFSDRLPVRYLVCTTPGQNAARNHGLKEGTGQLVVLADDDVLPQEGWLKGVQQGAQRWADRVLVACLGLR